MKTLAERAKSFVENPDQDSPRLVLSDAVREIDNLKQQNRELNIANGVLSARLKRIEDVIWNVK